MASIFTFDTASRVSSPWSTPGTSTPLASDVSTVHPVSVVNGSTGPDPSSMVLENLGTTKLGPEPPEGPVEYKLHLLLRPRRRFTSMSTSMQYSNDLPRRSNAPANPSSIGDSGLVKPHIAPSTHIRQARLQQLTTQLLWRLQQSSPFHSASTHQLVLPLLPDATPCLGVPDRPSTLLPGLEESQGALYEIGVADDGTLVGLVEEELNESLTNLHAMAASLGCMLELQRRVAVGHCEWSDIDASGKEAMAHTEVLWVAEALVRPDPNGNRQEPAGIRSSEQGPDEPGVHGVDRTLPENSHCEQLRVTLVGSSTCGKSSLLGTLTTSVLDNGRGKSRLSLLRHRHEIASGITSSVSQELLGYDAPHKMRQSIAVVNYNSSDISSWSDIHNAAQRLCFLCDSPGLQRYAKTTLRTLIAWNPHWTLVCVAAGEASGTSSSSSNPAPAAARSELVDFTFLQQQYTTFQHLRICLRLGLPIIIAVTKLDTATRLGLRGTVAQLLSIIKDNGRRPILLASGVNVDAAQMAKPDLQSISCEDVREAAHAIETGGGDPGVLVPIVLTSSVTGLGLGQLHALLSQLPLPGFGMRSTSCSAHSQAATTGNAFHVDEVFAIPPSKVYSSLPVDAARPGIVLCGLMHEGSISLGDELVLGPFVADLFSARDKTHSSGVYPPSLTVGSSQDASGRPLSADSSSSGREPQMQADLFVCVRVVSLRNLRLPVRSLLPGQVGTIGVVPGKNAKSIDRARKGMVLTDRSMNVAAYGSFTAIFASTDFTSITSPTLILGGHAVVYVNSVRAAVKVRSMAFSGDEESEPDSSQDGNVFVFDSDHNNDVSQADQGISHERKTVEITFQFVSSLEWLRAGQKVLVVPTTSATGPVTGPTASNQGLDGIVGVVCESDI